MTEEILIFSGARTAIGAFGGSLRDVQAARLGEIVFREAIARSGLSPEAVEQVVLGNVIPSSPADAYIARVAAIGAGIPVTAPALTVNRLCGSGLQAIISAAQAIALNECQAAVAGGAESMSNAPHYLNSARFGQKMGDVQMLDALTRTLSDPFENVHMGVTAENIASRCGVTREEQDLLAVESHRRAATALAEGRFKTQIVPVEIVTRNGPVRFETDEHVRPTASEEELAKLRPVFKRDGTVTAGNSSGINDGAAAVVLGTRALAERFQLLPRARILGWGHAGVEPSVMGLGPVRAVPIALHRSGIALSDVDIIEANEAFAAQACAVAKELGLPSDRTNPNGSGIALGHPVGATGAILTVKALYELERSGGRVALITMCIGGGQGIAMVIERLA